MHAVRQPIEPPIVTTLKPSRQPGATYAYLDGSFFAHPPSSQRVDVIANYVDPFDDGSNPAGAVQLEHQARVGEFTLAYGQGTSVPVSSLRHDFSDT